MKNQNGKLGIWVFIMVFLLAINADGQSNVQDSDHQWYVRNGLGWNGNVYNFGNIGTQFKILGVSGNALRNQSRNDLFVIYQDGTCYTNRLHNRINNGLQNRTYSSTFTDSSLQINSPKNINYLYWTNVYDDDDPRNNIQVSVSSNNSNAESLRVLEVDSMFAHQNIVPDRNVVVVIPPSNNVRKLKFNIVGGASVNILSLDHTFNSICLGSLCSYENNENKYEIKIKKSTQNKPVIISFKANETISPNLFGQLHTWKLYDVEGQVETLIDSFTEKILTSHDPNFIQLMGFCKKDGKFFAKYRAHFENTGEASVRNIRFEFNVPNNGKFKKGGKVCNMEAKIGTEMVDKIGHTFSDKMDAIDRSLVSGKHAFQNNSEKTASPLKHGNTEKASGYFEFCIEIEKPKKLFQNFKVTNYKLIKPIIYFDDHPTQIDEYYPKKAKIKTLKTIKCNCCEN